MNKAQTILNELKPDQASKAVDALNRWFKALKDTTTSLWRFSVLKDGTNIDADALLKRPTPKGDELKDAFETHRVEAKEVVKVMKKHGFKPIVIQHKDGLQIVTDTADGMGGKVIKL